LALNNTVYWFKSGLIKHTEAACTTRADYSQRKVVFAKG